MRAVGGIIAGLVVGFIAIIILGVIGLIITFRAPSNLNPYDTNAVIQVVIGMPAGAKIALLVALIVGTMAGVALARRITHRAWAAWTVAALITIYFVLFALSLPLAEWMQAMTIAAPILGALIGNHLERGIAVPAAATTTDVGDAPAEG